MNNFIKGMIFITLIVPCLDSLLSLFNQFIEFLCTKIAIQTYNIKQEIQTTEENEDQQTNVIGFQIASENDYEEE